MLFSSCASALVLIALTSSAVAQSTTGSSCPYTPTFVPCVGNANLDCASMDVAKDWTDEKKTEGDITLRLVRFRATAPGVNPDTAKSIIINPGGPGSSGIDAVVKGGNFYQTVAGRDFNIIGYDPRGVGLNMPYQCKPTRKLKPAPGSNPFATGYFQTAFDYYTDFAKACNEEWGGSGTVSQFGRLISTSQTARDIKAISERIGDKKLRFWGFSYGTVLGATIGNLFRNEIEGLIIDGNINPNDYYTSEKSPVEESTDVDRAVENFFAQCALALEGTGDNQCAWKTPAGQARTAQSLLDKWDAWVGADPFTESRGRTSNLDPSQSYIIRNFLFDLLKLPTRFPKVARILQYWYENPTQIPKTTVSAGSVPDYPLGSGYRLMPRQNAGTFDPSGSTSPSNSAPNAITGITCVDSRYHPGGLNAQTYADIFSAYVSKSRYGGDLAMSGPYGCMPWLTMPKEVFPPDTLFKAGGIATSPKPVMVIQTPYDPVTPEISGEAAAAAFSNGVLVKHNGAGHCSSADIGSTLLGAIQAYWQQGRTPTIRQYFPNQPNPFVSASATVPTQPTPSATAPVDSGDGSGQGSTVEQGTEPKSNKRSLDQFAGLVAPELSANVPDYSYMFADTPAAPVRKLNTTSTPAKVSKRAADTAAPETIGSGQLTATLDPPCDADTSTTTTTTTTTTGTNSGSSTSTSYGTDSTTTTTTTGTNSGSSTSTTSGTGSIKATGTYWTSSGYPYGGSSWTQWTPLATPKASSFWNQWTSKTTSSWEKWEPTPAVAAWGPWKTPDSYDPWNSQEDCVPVTKTKNGKTIVVAVPTKTVYIDYAADVCETGLYTQTITVTATCTQGCYSKPTGVPQGYTTTTVWCYGCAEPTNVVVTVKVPDNKDQSTQWTGIPVKPAAGTDSWSVLASTASPVVDTVAVQWGTLAASPVKPATATGNGEWNTWGSATGTGLVAKYTGGAVANVVASGGLVAAALAGLLVL